MKKIKIACIFLALGIITFLIIRITMEREESKLESISLEKLEEIVKETDLIQKQYVYIGREDCPDCTAVYPEICALSEKYNLHILYYNTKNDREDRYNEMMEVLEYIKVKSVPAIIALEDGGIELYSVDEFLQLIKGSSSI